MTYLQQLNKVNQELYGLGKEIQDKLTELELLKAKRDEAIKMHNELVEAGAANG